MADRGQNVLVVGTGTIGEPLIALLCDLRKELGIDNVTFYKHSPDVADRPKVKILIQRGADFSAAKEKTKAFKEMGLTPDLSFDEALDRATVVVDATSEDVGLTNKEKFYLPRAKKVKGFIAQGSEHGFGKPYALGINDEALTSQDQFVQVVSCNTHNIAVILKVLGLEGGRNNIKSGRFVCFRRGSDVGDNSKAIPAPQISTHDDQMGTHHARDVHELYKTLGLNIDVFSSAVKTNTQYMHTIWFDVELTKLLTREEAIRRFSTTPRVSVTNKTLASVIFAYGRDHGFYGRMLDQTVVCLPSITTKGNEVFGFCFTPQDGNSILSSAAAVERFLYPEDYLDRIKVFDRFLMPEV